jgi:hypothetical protein
MSFSADWLALREPVDHASRDAGLLARAIALAGPNALVADLGCGTGSTARACGGPDCADWQWRFLDGDAGLLENAKAHHPTSEQVVIDLKDIVGLPLDGVNLVTASALLDLMPRNWVDQLALRLRDAAVPFYAALNYNGIMHWSPALQNDGTVTAAFNTHQCGDKGIGPALGPGSAAETARIFEECGFDVFLGDSPWKLGPDQAMLHRATLQGIADAAEEITAIGVKDWRVARIAQVARATGYIGHTDILAVPRASGE